MDFDLCKALDNNEFVLHYQPYLDIRKGNIEGVEALLRWQHPELGLISPNRFIPLAEETGLVVPIGEWVLRKACSQVKAWQEAGYPPFVVSVNISPVQFSQGNIVETISGILGDTGLDPRYLNLEITENMMMDVDQGNAILDRLKGLGVHLGLDDFGKGYSSLLYLKRFPLDSLKIDQSFVKDCTTDKHDAVIVKTIISMAHHLELKVIAEGVESKAQLAFLQQNHCDGAQGFFFSKPLTSDEFESQFSKIEEMLRRHGMIEKSEPAEMPDRPSSPMRTP